MEPRVIVGIVILIVLFVVLMVIFLRQEASEKKSLLAKVTLSPAPGSKADPSTAITVTTSSPVMVCPSAVTITDGDGDETTEFSVNISSDGKTVTIQPSTCLEYDEDYTVSVAGIATWKFSTIDQPPSYSIWPDTLVPGVFDTFSGTITLGTVFHVDVPGYVTALRYYRPSGATSPATGVLWDYVGNQLAAVPFPATPKSGWVVAPLPKPVPIKPNVNYITSYMTNGVVAFDQWLFVTRGFDNGPLHAPPRNDATGFLNGVNNYQSQTTIFPTTDCDAYSYYADLVFVPSDGPPTCLDPAC